MPKILIITIAALLTNLTAIGQTTFNIGERTYPCTDAIIFVSEPTNFYDLYLYIAKEGEFGYVAASRKFSSLGEEFTGQLLLYLDNGSVITCNESEVAEKSNNWARALYPLTADQLNKLKASNIHKVKYTMSHKVDQPFSASNIGVKSNVLISELFDPTEKSSDIDKSADSLSTPADVEVSEIEPFAYVEQMPSFPNGIEAMYVYVYRALEYPAEAKAKKISGQVIVQFVISAEGEVSKAKVVRGIGGGCDEEALRVVNSMPTWSPGLHNGRPVPVTFTLPIKFVL